MTVEIQVALNFLISFLYNKLPRRRVNNFGEELEAALKVKFEGHWYPEKPFKGSAYRCLKTTPPLDPVFEIAARESGMDLIDIQENLPSELSIWIDPGEVSYRMSEKGPVKILYSEEDRIIDVDQPPREVTSTFNPEAQSFKPLDLMTSNFNNLSLTSPPVKGNPQMPGMSTGIPVFPSNMTPSFKTPVTAPLTSFGPKANNVTMTTGMFAQTKFGSTKLKSSGKRNQQRMSPTEFGNYIKQKALIQQQTASQMNPHSSSSRLPFGSNGVSPQNSRSISPDGPDSPLMDMANNYLFMQSTPQTPSPPNSMSNFTPFGLGSSSSSHFTSGGGSLYDSGLNGFDLFGAGPSRPSFGLEESSSSLNRLTSFLEKASPFVAGGTSSSSGSLLGSSPESVGAGSSSVIGETEGSSASGQASLSSSAESATSANKKNFENLNLTGVSYPNQYQHLLLAN